jgi:integrase
MPRALAPDTDRAVMDAVSRLDDPFARVGLTLLRATGMRAGELLDLELDCIVDFGGDHGTWLRVPVGKLGTDRMVPLDPEPLALLDTWIANRGPRDRPSRRGAGYRPGPGGWGHLADRRRGTFWWEIWGQFKGNYLRSVAGSS